jgi:hypothetical protein
LALREQQAQAPQTSPRVVRAQLEHLPALRAFLVW